MCTLWENNMETKKHHQTVLYFIFYLFYYFYHLDTILLPSRMRCKRVFRIDKTALDYRIWPSGRVFSCSNWLNQPELFSVRINSYRGWNYFGRCDWKSTVLCTRRPTSPHHRDCGHHSSKRVSILNQCLIHYAQLRRPLNPVRTIACRPLRMGIGWRSLYSVDRHQDDIAGSG